MLPGPPLDYLVFPISFFLTGKAEAEEIHREEETAVDGRIRIIFYFLTILFGI
jgi:hypothetical protein